MREDLDKSLELPEIKAATVQSLRAAGRLPRLPQMPGVSVDRYFMSDYRAQQAAEYAYAVGVAFEEKRRRDLIMRAKARAAARLAQAIAEYRIR